VVVVERVGASSSLRSIVLGEFRNEVGGEDESEERITFRRRGGTVKLGVSELPNDLDARHWRWVTVPADPLSDSTWVDAETKYKWICSQPASNRCAELRQSPVGFECLIH